MEAIVLAGGFGKRLRQVITGVPKPMAPVAGRPFLEILLGFLARKGFQRVILSLGFMAEKIKGHFGSDFAGMELDYVIENQPLGTGGGIRLALERVKTNHIFVFNGDTFLDLEVNELEKRWLATHRPLIVGRYVEDTARYGRLLVSDGIASGFAEKGALGRGLINAGCYVLSRDQLSEFPVLQAFSFESDYLVKALKSCKFDIFVTHGKFIDIGVPEDYLLAQTELLGHVGL